MAKNMLSLPPRQAQLADVDVDVSNRGGSELAALGAFVWVLGQSGDAVAFQAPVQAGARQLGTLSRKQLSTSFQEERRTSSSGSSVLRRNSTTMASSAGVSTVMCGAVGPIGASWVVVRVRHLVMVVRLSP